MQITPNFKVIASVHFAPLSAGRSYRVVGTNGNPQYNFNIPASERAGDVQFTRVYDMEERCGTIAGHPNWNRHATTCDLVARDLVGGWAQASLLSDFGGPGVCVCAGEVPTEDEIRAITLRQTAWANALYSDANRKWVEGKSNEIGSLHRDATKWLGKLDAPWVKDVTAVSVQSCPHCGEQIPTGIMRCPKCREVVDLEKYAIHLKALREIEEAAARRPAEQTPVAAAALKVPSIPAPPSKAR